MENEVLTSFNPIMIAARLIGYNVEFLIDDRYIELHMKKGYLVTNIYYWINKKVYTVSSTKLEQDEQFNNFKDIENRVFGLL